MTKEEWKKQNRERERENNKRWYANNKEVVAARKAQAYKENSEQEKLRTSEWKRLNKDKLRQSLLSNPSKRIAANIRSKISATIAGKQKTTTTIQYIGCSFEELKIHIESLFIPGMTWENYGRYGWHIDHIKPLALFDLTNEDELKQAWHFTNLRPLWAKDNLIKGKKF